MLEDNAGARSGEPTDVARPASFEFGSLRRETTREDLLRVRLVAYRGLWDRFAGPGTLGAFVRAQHRGIPFLVDLEVGTVALRDLLDEGLLQQAGVPVFLMTADAAGLLEHLRGEVPDENGNLFAVERSAAGGRFPIRVLGRGCTLQPCGHYLPLAAAERFRASEIPVRSGDLVLYESVDTIQSLDLMRASPIKSDEAMEAGLELASEAGAVVMKVCDLVERELLLNSMRWVAP